MTFDLQYLPSLILMIIAVAVAWYVFKKKPVRFEKK